MVSYSACKLSPKATFTSDLIEIFKKASDKVRPKDMGLPVIAQHVTATFNSCGATRQ
jgi:hypothetical protein